MTMTPTDEQREVLRIAQTGGDLRVVAFAGAGKTSTLGYMAEHYRQRTLYLAFNVGVARDAARKFPPWVDCRTTSSVAFGATGWPFKGRVQGTTGVVPTSLRDLMHVLGISQAGAHGRSGIQLMRAILATVRQFEYSADPRIEAHHIPREYLLVDEEDARQPTLFDDAVVRVRGAVQSYLVDGARQLWERMLAKGSTITVRHDTYIKLFHLKGCRIAADLILVDEAQDLNPVMAAILAEQRVQRVWVGDPFQAIYSFRGAVNALADLDAETAFLTQSFRWGPAVARLANTILETLGELPKEVRGDPTKTTQILDVDDDCPLPRTVICRGNAMLLVQALEAAERKTPVAVVGKLEPALRLLESAHALWSGAMHNVRAPEIAPFQRWDDFLIAAADDYGLERLGELVSRYGAGIPRMIQQLRENGERDEHDAQLILTTCHKAKGREWPHVTLANDYQNHAARLRAGEDILREEVNILYVAATRGQRVLRHNQASAGLEVLGRSRIAQLRDHPDEARAARRHRRTAAGE